MAGHSHWATIKRKKGKEDAKRGKVFTRLIREIMVASREGGGDPQANPRLRLLIEKAKAANMPADNITRAIKRGTGELAGSMYEPIQYEGYGPAGVAIIVDALTDNKNRTVADLRHLFSKYNGKLAENGAVSWMFELKGVIVLKRDNIDEDAVFEALLECPIEDVHTEEESIVLHTSFDALMLVKDMAQEKGFEVESAEPSWIAKDSFEVSASDADKVYVLLEKLEELDDVKDVYTNMQ